MRPDARNKRDYGRGYGLDTARRDLAMGVHFGVVAVRLGASEEDLALALDLSADEVVRAYEVGSAR